jgi:ABC-type glycerol-3-phosphate transport system permease component
MAAVPENRPDLSRRPAKTRRTVRVGRLAGWLLVAGGALLTAFPLYWMLVTSVSTTADLKAGDYGLFPREIVWAGFSRVFEQLPFFQWFLNSVIIAVVAVALTVTINVVCGYAFAKLRFQGRRVLFVLIVSTLIIPVQVLMVPQFEIVAELGWVDTYWGVIIPRSAEAFGIFFAYQFFKGIPDELIEAARLDGAGELTIVRSIVLPLSMPLIAVLVIFTFMWRWNEFAWPLIVLKDSDAYTLPVGLLFLQGQYTTDYPALMAGSLLSVLPMLAIFVIFQRFFVEGVARSGLK